jgi:hypothetical protein
MSTRPSYWFPPHGDRVPIAATASQPYPTHRNRQPRYQDASTPAQNAGYRRTRFRVEGIINEDDTFIGRVYPIDGCEVGDNEPSDKTYYPHKGDTNFDIPRYQYVYSIDEVFPIRASSYAGYNPCGSNSSMYVEDTSSDDCSDSSDTSATSDSSIEFADPEFSYRSARSIRPQGQQRPHKYGPHQAAWENRHVVEVPQSPKGVEPGKQQKNRRRRRRNQNGGNQTPQVATGGRAGACPFLSNMGADEKLGVSGKNY